MYYAFLSPDKPERASLGLNGRREVMQMDAAMGALTAIQDMFMHSRLGIVNILPGISPRWKECSFKGMPADGGFLISAKRENYATSKVEISSQLGGALKLANPWGEAKVNLTCDGKTSTLSGKVLSIALPKGKTACIELCI